MINTPSHPCLRDGNETHESSRGSGLGALPCSTYIDNKVGVEEDCEECLGKGYVWATSADVCAGEPDRDTCPECRGSCKKNTPVYLTIERLIEKIDAGKAACEWWIKNSTDERAATVAEHIWMALSTDAQAQEAMKRGHILPNDQGDSQSPGK